MNEFDDIFKRKMDEETHFEDREKSWSQVSQRLDAFQFGQLMQPKSGVRALRFWQIAAAASLVGLVWFAWKNDQNDSKNKILTQQLVEIEANAAILRTADSLKNVAEVAFKNSILSPAEFSKEAGIVDKNFSKIDVFAKNKQPKMLGNRSENRLKNKSTAQIEVKNNHQNTRKPSSTDSKIDQNLVDKLEISTSVLENQPRIFEQNKMVDSLLAIIEQQKTAFSIANFEQISTKMSGVFPDENFAPLIVFAEKLITRLARNPTRLRLGISAFAANNFVKNAKKPWSKGQGIVINYPLKNGFSVVGQADWGHSSYSTNNLPKHIRQPDSVNIHHPHSMNHHLEFRKADWIQAQQFFSVGLNYAIPTRFWLQPVARFGHNWVHSSAAEVTFEYEEKPNTGPPGPNPGNKPNALIARKFDSKWDKNIWRIGLGLDANQGAWTMGISADFTRDFSEKVSDNAMVLRAGLAYNF